MQTSFFLAAGAYLVLRHAITEDVNPLGRFGLFVAGLFLGLAVWTRPTEIFATALHRMRKLNGRDWETYWNFYQIILNAIRPPDLMIYLRCNMRTIRRRIRMRGRAMEQDIPLSYLKHLERLYEAWIADYAMGEVLILDSGKLDYIHDMVDCLDVMERIEALLPRSLERA